MTGASKSKGKPAPTSGRVPMTMSGFCMWPSRSVNSHEFCPNNGCTCECHTNN